MGGASPKSAHQHPTVRVHARQSALQLVQKGVGVSGIVSTSGQAAHEDDLTCDCHFALAMRWSTPARSSRSGLSDCGMVAKAGAGYAVHAAPCRRRRGPARATPRRPHPRRGSKLAPPGHVLSCETEHPLAEMVVPRLMAAGADCAKVRLPSSRACAMFANSLSATATQQHDGGRLHNGHR